MTNTTSKQDANALYAITHDSYMRPMLWQTAEQVAMEWLTDDSAQFDIRPDEDGKGFWMWVKPLNGKWGKYTFSLESDERTATAELLGKAFVDAQNDIDHGWFIATMSDYLRMLQDDIAIVEGKDRATLEKILADAMAQKP